MQLSRRALLAAGGCAAGGMLGMSGLAHAAPYLPDSRGLWDLLRPSIAALGGAARIQRLGSSRAGRPIDLITVGRGTRSVLVVGVPHANEPIGCLTIVHLLRRLAADQRFLDRSDATWHFIPAIDVDGLDMNSGWFAGPPTLDRYLRHFYRPAFALQPEYSFPLDMPGYRFDASTPENLCWQRALEIARPVLQSSLHGADSGGVFYMLSRHHPALATALSRQPVEAGLSLNELGEVDAGLRPYAPGVFSFFEIAPYLREASQAGGAMEDLWSAGASSAEFAAARYRSFSITCEIPIWTDSREASTAPSASTMADVLRSTLAQSRENLTLFEKTARLLTLPDETAEQRALAAAVREAVTALPGQITSLETQMRTADNRTRLPLRDLVRLEFDLALMRAPAMMRRLADLHHDRRASLMARKLLARRISQFQSRTRLQRIPVEISTALQMRSITTALELVG